MRMPEMSDGARPRRPRRRSQSVRLRPQSISTRVARVPSRASATVQLPPLPLASEAKRSKALLQLLVEEREDAACGLGALRGAVLVQHVHLRFVHVLVGLDLHAVLLRLHFRILVHDGIEHAREEALLVALRIHLAFGIGVAHEVDAVLPVAVLDREADTVEREADAPPCAVERLVYLEKLGAVVRLAQLGALLRRGGERRTRLLILQPEAHHHPAQELRFQARIARPRLPHGLLQRDVFLVHLDHAAVADVDLGALAIRRALQARAEFVALAGRHDGIEQLAEEILDQPVLYARAVLGPVRFHYAGGGNLELDEEAALLPELL